MDGWVARRRESRLCRDSPNRTLEKHERTRPNRIIRKSRPALPIGRVEEPEDLAETYLYLMRERFSTGAIIVVDGEVLWFRAVYEPVFSMPFKVNCCKKNRTPKPEGF
jgi:NAD(P)-dependent dehydrogenase (short-subunit alcohol dehydrogenase family)